MDQVPLKNRLERLVDAAARSQAQANKLALVKAPVPAQATPEVAVVDLRGLPTT